MGPEEDSWKGPEEDSWEGPVEDPWEGPGEDSWEGPGEESTSDSFRGPNAEEGSGGAPGGPGEWNSGEKGRAFCTACHKAASVCICGLFDFCVDNKIGITILQHPKEKYHPLGSARIALLGLARVQVIVVPLGVGKLRLMPKQPGSKRSACGRVGRSRGLKPRPGLEGDATRVPVPAADMGSDSGPQAERNGVPQPCMGQEREEAGASEPSSRQESDRGLRPCAVAQEGNEQEGTEEERNGEGEEGEEEGDDFCPMFQTGSSTSSEDVELMRDGSALALDSLALALDSSALPPEGSAQSLDNVASAQEQAATAPSEALEGSLTQRSRGITFTPANTSRGGGADGFSNREPPHTRSHASDTSTSTCAIPRSPEVPGVFEGLRALRQGAGGNERAQFLQKRWFVLPDRTGDPSAVQQGLQEALGPSMEGERGCDPSGQDCLIPDWLHVPPGTALLYPSRDSRELPSLPRDSRQLATLASERLGAGTGDCDRGLWRGVSAGCEEGVGAERGENNDSREQESDGVGKGSTQQAHEHCEQATAGGSREEKDKARRGSTQIPSHLIVLDGTWPKAKRVYKQNPWLQHLPQYHLPPEAIKPSVYGPIRKEPKMGCISTIEAVVYALQRLEPDTANLDRLLSVFNSMVGTQIQYMKDNGKLPGGGH